MKSLFENDLLKLSTEIISAPPKISKVFQDEKRTILNIKTLQRAVDRCARPLVDLS